MIGLDLNRYAEMIRRLTGADEVVPPGLIWELDRPEFSFLKRETLFATMAFVGANPAGSGCVELRPGSATQTGLIVVTGVKVCGVNTAALDRFVLTLNGAAAGTPAPCTARDLRLGQGGVPASTMVQTQIKNGAGVSGVIIDEVSASVAGQDLNFMALPVILEANAVNAFQRLQVYTVAVNKALRVVFTGYERPARVEELAD